MYTAEYGVASQKNKLVAKRRVVSTVLIYVVRIIINPLLSDECVSSVSILTMALLCVYMRC